MNTEALTETIVNSTNAWEYIAIIELVIILILLAFVFHLKNKNNIKNKIKDTIKQQGGVDANDVMKDIWLSKGSYDELKKKCHPDRFVGDENKQQIANEIFQEITKNKNNYQKLQELKQRAINELNINI